MDSRFGLLLAASLLGCECLHTPPSAPAGSAPGKPLRPRAAFAAPPGLDFKLRSAEAGLSTRSLSGAGARLSVIEGGGPGVCFLDYDQDGDEDLYVVSGQTWSDPRASRSALYRNRGDASFEDVTQDSGTGEDGWAFGCVVADYDQDGFPDLFVAAFDSDRLYHNLGDGRFAERSAAAGLVDSYSGESASFGDVNKDGLPDLYVTNYVRFEDGKTFPPTLDCSYAGLKDIACGPRGFEADPDFLYLNRGDGTFEDVSERAGIRVRTPTYGMAVVIADLDGDSWPDIYVGNDSTANWLFRNQGDGTFSEEGVGRGLAVSGEGKPQASMGIALGDMDGDGWDDLVVTNFSNDYNTLYRNERGQFLDVSTEAGLYWTTWDRLAWATLFLDADSDGALDLFFANGHVYPGIAATGESVYEQECQLFRGDGRGKFALADAGDLSRQRALWRGAAHGDLDRDGDLDIVAVRLDETPALFLNRSRNGSSVAPRLQGSDCNRDAIGAVLEIETGGRRQHRQVFTGGSYTSSSSLRQHLGLGEASGPLEAVVTWPCGRRERFALSPGGFPDLVEGRGTEAGR